MNKKFITIIAFLAFVYGFFAGTNEGKEAFHGAVEGWWSYLNVSLNTDVQELRESRHETIKNSIREYRQQKVELAKQVKEELAEQIRMAPDQYTPEKQILLTEVKYPNLTIVAQDANKRRVELGRDEAVLIPRIIVALPPDALDSFQQIIIQYGNPSDMRRGMAGGGVMFVKDIASMRKGAKEFIGVFVHEAGHVVDIAYMKGSKSSGTTAFRDGSVALYADDPSVEFYSFNWANDTTTRENVSNLNFPSRYAMTDSFENFAEVFNAYVTQPEALRTIASKNEILGAHYKFIQEYLYDGGEFVADVDSSQLDTDPRVWDTTVMPITDLVVDSRI